MAITATYSDSSGVHTNTTIKLTRIWGSKQENWNAWVVVLQTPGSIEPITTFSVQAEYVEGENPYTALYNAVAKLSFVTDVIHDVQVSTDKVEPDKVEPETIDEKPKKQKATRKTKS